MMVDYLSMIGLVLKLCHNNKIYFYKKVDFVVHLDIIKV